MTDNKTPQQKNIERRQSLSPQKQALLAKRLQGKAVSPDTTRRIMPAVAGDIVPVSYSQQRLWFVQQLDPAATDYNRPTLLRITGTLDIVRLEQAINHILSRHEILRTVYSLQSGELFQKVLPPSNLSLKQEDLPQNEPAELEKRVHTIVEQPFDLSSGPLVRLHLFRLADKGHLLLFVTHHIALDRWSEDVFIRELEAAYAKRPLPELSIQYADFAAWQRSAEQEARLEPHLAYWKDQLGGELPVLKLPEDHSRPATQDRQGGSLQISVPAPLLQALKDLARSQGSTLFMLLLTAYKVLLYRYTGQTDQIVGSPIAGRLRPELEPLIGCFINNLVLRSDLSGNPPFAELLQRLRKVTLEAYQHQEVPFELLVRELKPERDLSRSPLFQTMFNFENIPQAAPQQGITCFQLVEISARVALYDLSVELTEQDDCLACNFKYSKALFEPETIVRLAGHYLTLLESILTDPLESIAALPMLTVAERQQMLVQWNAAETDYTSESCLHQLFERWVQETPYELAVVLKDQKLTYAELESQANSIAAHLVGLGVGSESKVALFMDRSVEMIACMLGILKAGGAYVPLDIQLPDKRLGYLLADSNSGLVLTHRKYIQKMAGLGAQALCFEDILPPGYPPLAAPQVTVRSGNLAYIIYTSGSTGKPKGVMITHRNVIGFLSSYKPFVQDGPRRVGTSVAPFNFDTSMEEIFSNLCFGGTLHILLPEDSINAAWLTEYLVEHSITTVFILPNLLLDIANAFKDRRGELKLKCLVTGLEPKKEVILQSFREMLPGLRILNVYGPTEVTVRCTGYIFKQMKDPLHDVPIGVPFPNYQVYVVDKNLQPVPVGVVGELLIAGVGIARGYLNRPGLSAEKFIPNPFSAQPGERLYRSGDMARYLPDGNIEFLGRVDDQIKLRGYRIEPGEIESNLVAHPMVSKCLVMVREEQPGDKRLVVYVIPAPGTDPTGTELRTHLAARLPAYMLPGQIIKLDAFPLLTNGKVNRSLLPAPEHSRPELEQPFVPARTPTEQNLAAIWAEVLGLEQVGVLDNFFDLGGHSLLATKILSLILNNLGADLPLRRMFETPTIAANAADIDGFKTNMRNPQSEMIRPVSREKSRKTHEEFLHGRSMEGSNLPLSSVRSPQDQDVFVFPVSFAQQMMWILDQLDPGNPAYNMVSAFRLTGELDVNALEESLNTILQRHESLRTTFSLQNGVPVQVVAPFKPVSLAVSNLEHLPVSEKEVETGLLLERTDAHFFNLSEGPLIQTSLIKLASHEHLLIFNLHHIISDGLSLNILWRELSSLYAAYSKGFVNPLPDLPIQYADFSVWQREWLQGSVLADHLVYWKQKLADVPTLEMPVDRPRPAVFTHQGNELSFEFSSRLSAALKEFSRKNNVTLYTTLLAAFKVLLYRYSGQADIAVATFSANRNRVEVEGLIGFFVNTLVLRTQLRAQSSFSNLLQEVRKNTLDTYAHQELPFEKLVEELRPIRDLGRNPFVQTAFNSQSMSEQELDLAGLKARRVKTSTRSTKMDLSFGIEYRPDGLEFSINYYTALYNEAFIQRLARHYLTLLESILANPQESIASLPMLSASERQQMLVDWNNTRVDRPKDQCLHHLFEAQAALRPDNIALVFEDQQVSYGELEQSSNRLARHLQFLGVGPEVMVGIYLERSPEMVTCVLAVLKAGGAFVPLDTSHPTSRTTAILENSQAPIVLTRQGLVSDLEGYTGHLILLDTHAHEIAGQAASQVESPVCPDNLAYVIHTSGTTGVPKGVLLHHGGVVNLVREMCAKYPFSNEDRFLFNIPLSFDVSVFAILLPLSVGGRLIVAHPERHNDAVYLLNLIAEWNITILSNITSSMLENILEEYGLRGYPSLRRVFCGGEATSLLLVNHFFEQTSIELINWYGPTETSIAVTHWRCQPGGLDGVVPIGRPMANTQIYVLDKNLQPVPIGVPGELYLSGVGLGRGYLGLPGLTAASFIPNPFSIEPGERMYKTGDQVRYLPDGNIEFLGRVDQQVKIRGFRIELGEIETTLGEHTDLQSAVVVPVQNKDKPASLAAYYVSKKGHTPTAPDLRTFLKTRLPDYMLPSYFIPLASLPLTPHGKIDLGRLPAPDNSRPELEQPFVPASTRTEQKLAAIWADVLGVEQVGVLDNFFDLGGHSLLATRIIALILASEGVDLPLRLIFENPTIAQLAVEIDIINTDTEKSQAATIQPVSREKYRKTR